MPAPVVIGEDRVVPQQTIEADDPKNVEYSGAAFLPERDAIDFYESLEGMCVGVRDAEVVGPTASFAEIPVRRRRLQVVTDKQGNVSLSVSPGRIDPTNPAFEDSRNPVVGQFKIRGQTVFVAGGAFLVEGRRRPAVRPRAAAGAFQ